MSVDLTKAVAVIDSDWQTETVYEPDMLTVLGEAFPIDEKEPVTVFVHHTKNGQITIHCKTRVVVSVPCARCLKPVPTVFEVAAGEQSVLPAAAQTEESHVEGFRLDTNTWITQEILLQWPAKVLCRADCKGLCSVCGHNLNHSECGCNRTVLDPRMASIQDIFNQFQHKSNDN